MYFPWSRRSARTFGEIATEVGMYGEYRTSFNAARAANPMLSYAVVRNDSATDLRNLDKWYERDAGEVIGKHTIYRLRLRAD